MYTSVLGESTLNNNIIFLSHMNASFFENEDVH